MTVRTAHILPGSQLFSDGAAPGPALRGAGAGLALTHAHPVAGVAGAGFAFADDEFVLEEVAQAAHDGGARQFR